MAIDAAVMRSNPFRDPTNAKLLIEAVEWLQGKYGFDSEFELRLHVETDSFGYDGAPSPGSWEHPNKDAFYIMGTRFEWIDAFEVWRRLYGGKEKATQD